MRVGDRIKAVAVVNEKIDARNELRLQTICSNQHGEKVVGGEAVVRIMETE